jgi:lysophospholipase L1-like esterase
MTIDRATPPQSKRLIIFCILSIFCFLTSCMLPKPSPNPNPNAMVPIRYVPIGDSYTIGEGVDPMESWPMLLTKHLQREGIPITLVHNPAVTGWTVQAAIEGEVPHLELEGANFSTLLIGANDLVRGFGTATFRARLGKLMDAMLGHLPGPKRLLVITIPDFSRTPGGAQFATSDQIAAFNAVITEEAAERGLPVFDLFALSQTMKQVDTAEDGLHPSKEGHAMWEAALFPIVLNLFK